MTDIELLKIFKKVGGYITDSHLVYTSGKHGSAYLNKDAIYPHTDKISKICKSIAKKFRDFDVEVVASPALGGIILTQWTAYYLSQLKEREVLAVYTEKVPDENMPGGNNQVFTRGYDKLVEGKKVLIVEDITTTGGSVKKVLDSTKQINGEVKAVCVLVNRNSKEVNSQLIGAPFYSLAEVNMSAWDESACPLCKKGIPINTQIGKGRDFLKKRKKA